MSARSASGFHKHVSQRAKLNGWLRKINDLRPETLDAIPSTPEEMKRDWVGAVASCLRETFADSNCFTSHDESWLDCLASAWLDDIKELNAHNIWLSRWETDGVWSTDAQREQYYLEGCREIHEWLVNHERKRDHRSEFPLAKRYIEQRYLEHRKLRLDGQELSDLVQRKAHRISELTRNPDQHQNRVSAQGFVQGFYTNIIPAVEGRKGQHVDQVLKALQGHHGTQRQSLIVNAFEAALAVHFLDADAIRAFEKRAGPVF